MATKPTVPTDWALQLVQSGASNNWNKLEPEISFKDFGSLEATPTDRQTFNYQLNALHLWKEYLDLAVDEILVTQGQNDTTYLKLTDAVEAPVAGKVPKFEATGDITSRFYRSQAPNSDVIGGGLAFRYSEGTTASGANNYIRFCDNKEAIREWLDVPLATHNHDTVYVKISDTSETPAVNKVARYDSFTDLNVRTLRSSIADQSTIGGALAFRVESGTAANDDDNYIRYCSNKEAIRNWLELLNETESDNKYRQLTQNLFDRTETTTLKASSTDTAAAASFRSATGDDAFISVNSVGNFSFNLGYSVSLGKVVIGGGSFGNTEYELYHSGNLPPTVDNLTSTSTTQPLSANQGRVLNTNKLDVTGTAANSSTLEGRSKSEVITDTINTHRSSTAAGVTINFNLVAKNFFVTRLSEVDNTVTLAGAPKIGDTFILSNTRVDAGTATITGVDILLPDNTTKSTITLTGRATASFICTTAGQLTLRGVY